MKIARQGRFLVVNRAPRAVRYNCYLSQCEIRPATYNTAGWNFLSDQRYGVQTSRYLSKTDYKKLQDHYGSVSKKYREQLFNLNTRG